MDSGWGRKPYWSGGIAFATATDKPLRAAKCLAYSPATPEGADPAARGERATKSSGAAAHSVRVFITPPQNLRAPKLDCQPARVHLQEKRSDRLEQKQQRQNRTLRLANIPLDSRNPHHFYCAGERGCGSVAQIRAAQRERCKVAVRLRQRPKNCRLNCCASIQSTRKPKRCAMRRTFSRAEV